MQKREENAQLPAESILGVSVSLICTCLDEVVTQSRANVRPSYIILKEQQSVLRAYGESPPRQTNILKKSVRYI
jgi:hypothetical protein